MKNTETFTEKEWEELASMLSEEKGEQKDLLDRFVEGDTNDSGKKWKDLRNMYKKDVTNCDIIWP